MIGRLHGTLAAKHPPSLLLDVGGVGYEVDVPLSIFYRLPEQGREVTLLTHLVVREDAQQLYGFMHEGERDLFRGLLKVSGVGAKLALAILSGMNADEFARCVEHGDADALARLPGIGKKTAGRLILEMRGRLAGAGEGPAAAGTAPADAAGEAAAALTALGYKPADAHKMVRQVDEAGLDAEALIRRALKARGSR